MKQGARAIQFIFCLLPAAMYPASDAVAKNRYFWSPMNFDGGIKLEYRWTVSQGNEKRNEVLIINFFEHVGGDYDVVTKFANVEGSTVTESGLVGPAVWAMNKIKGGQPKPTQKNFSMVVATNLVLPSMAYFLPILGDDEAWRKGFTTPHPSFPGSTVTVTTDSCSYGERLTGRVFKLVSAQGTMSACIAPDFGLPLSLTASTPDGVKTEYILQHIEQQHVEVPALFHKGEPDGFDNIRWGTRISAVKGLALHSEESAGVSVYRRPGSSLKFWGVPFKSIDYYFRDGKFTKIVGDVGSEENWRRLKDALFREYGQPFKETDLYIEGMDTYAWIGNGRTTIRIQSAGRADENRLEMSSQELERSEFDALFDEIDAELDREQGNSN